jgi:hypothetical protein
MLDPKEEAKFDELKAKCRELKVPAPPEIMIGLQVHENGVLTFDDVQRGHSWTRNFWNCIMGSQVWGGAQAGSTYAAGSNRLKAPNAAIGQWYSWVQWGYYGDMNIGTGDTAATTEDYYLAAVIASGNGAGQLLASAMSRGTPSYDSGTHVWTVTDSKIFNNNSGGSITVKETGLHIAASQINYQIERSVLSPTVAVANGAQLTVTYAISMDFSAID